MVFYVNKCQVKIEFSFLLIVAFSLLLNINSIIELLIFSSLHEAAHILTLLLFGFCPDSVTLAFYGIGMKHSAKMSANREALFLLSGTAVNLIFALLNVCREINFALFFINILPVYPLDGGRALSLFIHGKPLYIISFFTVLLLIIYSVFTINISLLLITVYLIVYSINEVV